MIDDCQFETFFATATGGKSPYPYQTRFATEPSIPHLVRAPTAAGKTATAILGWLYRRVKWPEETPRRLVYCLPMRVLVEQTAAAARNWVENLAVLFDDGLPRVHVLMGGVETEKWYLKPEQPAILIGTQDMLLSRALNRGYAATRFHWPIDFGLLNNDCLWVYDEPQLMDAGVSTSAQLAGLRHSFGTSRPCPSVWMSATLEPKWLETIDFRDKAREKPLELADEDGNPALPLYQRMTAEKTLRPLGESSSMGMKEVARAIVGGTGRSGVHQAGTQTLVIVNTVDRAVAVYDELLRLRKQSSTPELLLIHSRFRSSERRLLNERLQRPGGDRIIVSTQVVEAGVDISARTLVTELAPWSSLVQRMGRCNRTGDDGPGEVHWVDVSEKQTPPYSKKDLDFAREQLNKLDRQSVSPRDLDRFKADAKIVLPFEHKHVLRRRDLLDLFDTAPDLSGNDIDIQRFIRNDENEVAVQVFWRVLNGGGSARDKPEPLPLRDELCNVPVGSLRDFLKARKDAGSGFSWDHLDGVWARVDPKEIRPGMTIMLPADLGGYDWDKQTETGKGWDSGSRTTVSSVSPVEATSLATASPDAAPEAVGSDINSSLGGQPLTIAEHTGNVHRELTQILDSLGVPDPWRTNLLDAARWHDVGKAHDAFQAGIRFANQKLKGDPTLWAKSGNRARMRHGRKSFRHELASALTVLQQGHRFEVAYLVLGHHGRLRLAIRALPGEDEPKSPDTSFAMGVHSGDVLPAVDLGPFSTPEIVLDLTPMRMGGAQSWTARALALLAEVEVGPFRLAYLEALLRSADMRASEEEANQTRNSLKPEAVDA